ncbi:MAG: SDR family NAD(P)-dependent oxidoreductase [Acidimicrobiia bacterium]|nr:SDR family NAD(P)-dependent oxidoreductase [Acidimicrobiia bacterium]
MTVALVTGSNSGIGRATAVHLARQGFDVYASMRNLANAEKLQGMADQAGVALELVQLDVGDDGSVRRGIAEVVGMAGQVDVLVNNAGVGGNGVTEECTIDLYEEVMNANLYGAIRCIQAVLPGMRERRSGSIVNISSVVGKIAHIGQSPYYVSKWAMEAMSEGLAQEVAPFGVRVAVIEPGITKSAIFAKNVDAPNQTGAYDAHYRRLFQFYAAGIPAATPPEEVAALVHHAVTTDKPKLRYACSWGGAEIVAGRQAMSDEDWVALGALEDDDEYYARFSEVFGVDIRV